MSDISILKLMDGSTIVGRVIEGDGCVEIEHPIELVNTAKSDVLQELIGEQISLRPLDGNSRRVCFHCRKT